MFWVILSTIISFFLIGGCDSTSLKSHLLPPESTGGKDCSYGLESQMRVRVDVAKEKESLYGNREQSEWILVKREANIPSWKVWSGGNNVNDGYGEMAEIGTTLPSSLSQNNPDSANKRVFIGRGHCRGTASETCVDPLPASVVFVLQKEGAAKNETVTPDDDRWWWQFNVYYDANLLPTPPSNSDLPSWIKECRDPLEGRTANLPNASSVAGTHTLSENKQVLGEGLLVPPSIVQKNNIVNSGGSSVDWETIPNTFLYERTIAMAPEGTWADQIGTYQDQPQNNFSVWLSKDGQNNLVLDPQNGSRKYFFYNPAEGTTNQVKTLQLGSFNPKGKVVYEWWTPSCKPAIYLYPKKATRLSVTVKPQGKITVSEPKHGTGWQVTAYPDGTIVNNKIAYLYLYYEAEIEKIAVPQDGWIVKTKDLSKFFADILPKLGLNQKESGDFLNYWLPKLSEGEKWFVGLISNDELDRVEKIEFSTPPDNFIRIRFYFEKIEGNSILDKEIYSPEEALKINFLTPKRQGFTAVDWGGIIENGSCGLEATTQ